jgi:hypothetical protein
MLKEDVMRRIVTIFGRSLLMSPVARVVKTKGHIFVLVSAALFVVACSSAWLLCLRPPSAHEITHALDATIIPKLSLRDAPYSEGVEIVLRDVRRHHPELERVRFISYFPEGAPLPSPDNTYFNGRVTLALTAIPANEALRYIAAMSSLGYAIRDGGIYFYAQTMTDGGVPPLTVRERLTTRANDIYWHVREVFRR